MKKWIALLLSLLMCLSLCACGGGGSKGSSAKSSEITKETLSGTWYDIHTFQNMTFQGDGTMEYDQWASYPQSGDWKIEDGKVHVHCSGWDEDDFTYENGALNAGEFSFVRWEDLEMQDMALNKTVKSDNLEIQVADFVFSDEIPNECLASLSEWFRSQLEGHLEESYKDITEQGAYAVLTLEITNLAKEAIYIISPKNVDIALDYNNGYLFNTRSLSCCFFSGADFAIGSHRGCVGEGIELQPLQTKTITICLPCSEKIASDESTPATISFIAHFVGTDVECYRYVIR